MHAPNYAVLESEVSLFLAVACNIHNNMLMLCDVMQFLTQKGGQHVHLLQLVDELTVPGIKEGKTQANMLHSRRRSGPVLLLSGIVQSWQRWQVCTIPFRSSTGPLLLPE